MDKKLVDFERFLIKNRKKILIITVIIIVVIIAICVVIGISNGSKLKACNNLYNDIDSIAYKYAEDNKILPIYQGENVVVDLDTLDPITYKNKTCKGSVKYTKYNDTYIKTFNISDCGCDTSSFGKETETYKKSTNMDVVTYYNYYEASTNYSPWTEWLKFEDIDTEETDGVKLPINKKKIPTVSKEAIILAIEKEDKTYYSYRDLKWKWYKNQAPYSAFSSTAPAGYPNKDTNTVRETEPTDWSLTYPDTYDYRRISTKTGYRWYKTVDGKKEYWESGKFYPTAPSEEYKKDSSNYVNMYSYVDKEWRFYQNTRRNYGYFSSTQPSSYPYRDDELTEYTNWTSWSDVSHVDASNSAYREERTNLHSRYRVKYKMLTYLKLGSYLTRDEFEEKMGKPISELMQDESLQIDVKFKFKY